MTDTDTATDSENATDSAGTPGNEADDGLGTVCEIDVLGPCKKRVKASVPAAKVAECLDRNYDELVSTVQLPGFRRGRVPRRLLEKRYGEEVLSDVKETLVGESFREVLEEHELKILGAPQFDNVEIESGADLTYEVELQVHPEFELPQYKGIEVEYSVETVDEERVETELERFREQHATLVEIDPVDAGEKDYYFGHYVLHASEASAGENSELVSRQAASFQPDTGRIESFEVPGLADALRSWDRSSFGSEDARPLVFEDVVVPEYFSEEALRGQTVRMEFHLEGTRTRQIPEWNEELFEKLDVENQDELRKEIRESLERQAEQEAESKAEKEILRKIIANADLDVPQDLVDRQRKEAEERFDAENSESENAAEGGQEGEEFEGDEQGPQSREEAGEKAAKELIAELEEFFVLDRIGEKEKIFATEDDVKTRVRAMSAVYGVPESSMIRQLQESGRLDEIRVSLRNEKIRSWLRKKADIRGLPEKTVVAEEPSEAATEDVE